jgi:hypothetical protein
MIQKVFYRLDERSVVSLSVQKIVLKILIYHEKTLTCNAYNLLQCVLISEKLDKGWCFVRLSLQCERIGEWMDGRINVSDFRHSKHCHISYTLPPKMAEIFIWTNWIICTKFGWIWSCTFSSVEKKNWKREKNCRQTEWFSLSFQ